MGFDPLTLAIIGSAVVGAGTSIDAQRKAKNQAEDASRQAEQQAQQAAQQAQQQADQQFNRANQRRPDAMPGPAGAGGSSTMLTGPQGIDPGVLPLGKSTLLGQ